MSPHAPKAITQDIDVAFKPKQRTERDTFPIQKVFRDPFLGHLVTTKKTTTSFKAKKTNSIIPNITYSGLIKQQNASNKVFVINNNNKQYLLKKGQKADSITLLRGNSHEIVVKYNNNIQTIKRQ